MFAFNIYDCTGIEYVCLFKDGVHHVIMVQSANDEGTEVFTGHYEACVKFVDDALIKAQESMF